MPDQDLKDNEQMETQEPAVHGDAPDVRDADSRSGAPEPPSSYRGHRDADLPFAPDGDAPWHPESAHDQRDPGQLPYGSASHVQPGNQSPNSAGLSVQRFINAAQIMALVSLIIGGVVLSSAAVITAFVGLRKASALAGESNANEGERDQAQRIRRAAFVGLVMSVLALALNVVALILFYPQFLEAMQNGGYGMLFGGGQAATGGSESIWG